MIQISQTSQSVPLYPKVKYIQFRQAGHHPEQWAFLCTWLATELPKACKVPYVRLMRGEPYTFFLHNLITIHCNRHDWLLHRGLGTKPFPLVLLTLCVQDSWNSYVTEQIPWRAVPVALAGKLEAHATIYSLTVQSITLITIVIPDMMSENSSHSPLPQSQNVSKSAKKTQMGTTAHWNRQWYEGEKHRAAAWINYP